MACDMFSSRNAYDLLKDKSVHIFGSSNIRCLYKDLIWLLEHGSLIPSKRLKCKNEVSYANDVRVSNGTLHGGRDYEEIRVYKHARDAYIKYQFMTRLYLPKFIDSIKNLTEKPNIVVINSCIWDLSRWGPEGVQEYKINLFETFRLLRNELPQTHIIWTMTLPTMFTCRGGFLEKKIEFVQKLLPWHIMFANNYASEMADLFRIDVLDLHYHFRFLSNHHTEDGIHWVPKAMRYATNLLLTHIALAYNQRLPGVLQMDEHFVQRSKRVVDNKYDQRQRPKRRLRYRRNRFCNSLSQMKNNNNKFKLRSSPQMNLQNNFDYYGHNEYSSSSGDSCHGYPFSGSLYSSLINESSQYL